MIARFFLVLALLCMASPAQAGPLAAVIPIVIGALKVATAIKIALTVAASLAVSMLSKASKKKAIPPGIQTERKLTGGINSRTIMLGYYATAGSEVAPPMSQGNSGETPNAYLTLVVALSDARVHSLKRLIINGEYVSFNAAVNETYGHPIGGKYAGRAWIKFYDGTQTTADPMLLSKFGSYVRPWDANKIGKGVAYAILTYKYDADLFKGEPDVKFELWGMPLYDPRKDSTVGGSGAHRWSDTSTWEITFNNIVMVYNLLRGITFPDGTKYGGECTADDLPLANWAAGMNVCDETVTTSEGTEARYRAGFEIRISEMEPADAIEELLKGCSADIVEAGGIYKVRVGPPALPVMFISDGDFLVSEPRDFDPFPSFTNAKNMVYATYPSPGEGWNSHEAPVITDAALLERDQGVEMPASLSLPAAPYPLQVQRLMTGWLRDDQRWRQHSATLGHYGFVLEPLDTIAWTSEHNQYDAKVFQIEACSESLTSLNNTLALREVDPDDYGYTVADELPDPIVPGIWDLPPVQAVPGFGAAPVAIQDAAGNDRRPGVKAYWNAAAADDATLIRIQVEQPTTGAILTSVGEIQRGEQIIADGILPNTVYRVRGQFVVDRPTEWSSWYSVTTYDIKLGALDIDESFEADISEALDLIAAAEADISVLQAQGSALVADVAEIEAEILAVDDAIDTLTTKISAGAGNLVRNSNFGNGLVNWTQAVGIWTRQDDQFGTYARTVSNGGPRQIYSDTISVVAGAAYTISADMYNNASTGYFALKINFYDSGSNFLSSILAYKPLGEGFTSTANGRIRASGVAPVGVAHARVIIDADGNNNDSILAVRQVKLERAATMSPYTEEASVAQNYLVASNQAGQLASLTTTVSTQGGLISSNATAISTLTTNSASLTIKINAAAVNVIKNPTFAAGQMNWAIAGSSWVFLAPPSSSQVAYYAQTTADGFIYSEYFDASPGSVWTVSADMYFTGPAGDFFIYIAWYNSSGTEMDNTPLAYKTRGQAFATNNDGRIRSTGTAPAGARYGRVFIRALSTTAGSTVAAVTAVKAEQSATMSPFTQDAAIAQNYQAISTLDTQYASLSSTVSTQGASISTNATAISTVNSTLGTLSTTVSSLGGTVSTNSSSITTLQGNYTSLNGTVGTLSTTVSTLSSTVSTQGASISANATAISTAQGNITTLFARYGVELDVSGYVTGFVLNNNGARGDFAIRADKFSITAPSGGARTEFSNGNWRVYDGGGNLVVQMGVW